MYELIYHETLIFFSKIFCFQNNIILISSVVSKTFRAVFAVVFDMSKLQYNELLSPKGEILEPVRIKTCEHMNLLMLFFCVYFSGRELGLNLTHYLSNPYPK